MTENPETCRRCGTPLRAALPGLGSICPACLVQAAQTPGSEHSSDGRTTWAGAFPQLEIECLLRDEPEAPVYLARLIGEDSSERAMLQVVSGSALERAGGAPALQGRAQRLAAADLDGLAEVLDFGDLADAFFLITAAPDALTLPAAMARREEGELEPLLRAAATEAEEVLRLGRARRLQLSFDPATCFVLEGGRAVTITPLLLTAGEGSGGDDLLGPQELRSGMRVGSFELVEKVGEGGFGEVWRARQERPVKREVALKVLKGDLHSQRARARFRVEQQALARLDHPHIARFFEGATLSDGRPYFAMEWIEGRPLVAHCVGRDDPLEERLRLFRELCEAVHFAHQKGIIHRDLKSSNVLVGGNGGGPGVKVIDFGIARALEEPLTDGTLLTRAEDRIGTPATMSPEQAAGAGGAELDARSDVYGLGALLYELLTGQLPFDPKLPADELRRQIREEDPRRPSSRVEERRLADRIRGELDWITMRCLEKEPARRYRSVSALLRDLERHANDEPVEAGPPELAYRVRKFVRRNRGLAVAGAFSLFALVSGVITSLLGMAKAKDQAARAIVAERRSEGALSDARALAGFMSADSGRPADAALWFAYAAHRSRDPQRAAQNKRRFVEWTRGQPVPVAFDRIDEPKRMLACDLKFSAREDILRVMEIRGSIEEPERAVRILPIGEVSGLKGFPRTPHMAADFHPLGPVVAFIDFDGDLNLYNYERGEWVAHTQLMHRGMTEVAFSPDGTRLAVGGIPLAGELGYSAAVLRADDPAGEADWVQLGTGQAADYPAYLRWSPDGRHLAAGIGADRFQWYRSSPENKRLEPVMDQPVPSKNLYQERLVVAAFPRDSQSVVISTPAPVELSLEDGEVIHRFRTQFASGARHLRVAPDLSKRGAKELVLANVGPWINAYGRSQEGPAWEAQSIEWKNTFELTPDGSKVLSFGDRGAIELWDRQKVSPEPVPILQGDMTKYPAARLSTSGDHLAVARADGRVIVWRYPIQGIQPDYYCPVTWASTDDAADEPDLEAWLERWAPPWYTDDFSPRASDSSRGTVNSDGSLLVPIPVNHEWQLQRATASWALPGMDLVHRGFVGEGILSAGCFSPVDPSLLVTGHSGEEGGHLAFWNARSGEELEERIPIEDRPNEIVFSPDGSRIAVVGTAGEVVVISDLGGKREVLKVGAGFGGRRMNRVAFSPDGSRVLSWGIGTLIRCWDVPSGRLLWKRHETQGGDGLNNRVCYSVVFGADESFAVGAAGGRIRWRSLGDGKVIDRPILAHDQGVWDMLLTPDGRRLVSACFDGVARVWDVASGELVSSLDHGGAVLALALTAEGNVVSGGRDGGFRVWDPETGNALTPKFPSGVVTWIRMVSHQGREVALVGEEKGGIMGYDLSASPLEEEWTTEECLELAELLAFKEVSAAGSLLRLSREEWDRRVTERTEGREFMTQAWPAGSKRAHHRLMSDRAESPVVRDWHREELRKIDPRVAAELDRVEERRTAAARRIEARGKAMEAIQSGELEKAAGFAGEVLKGREDSVVTPGSMPLALVLGMAGRRDEMRDWCHRYVERFEESEDPWTLRMASRACFALPGEAREPLAGRARAMAHRAVELSESGSDDQRFSELALGLAELRMGDPAEASQRLEIARESELPFCRVPSLAYAAMAESRLGRAGQAESLLESAEKLRRELSRNAENAVGIALSDLALEEARSELVRE